PEYRKKILYTRYEKKFKDHYASRFDALFSTMGPEPAIRQRKALGYKSNEKWLRYFVPLKPLGGAILLAEKFRLIKFLASFLKILPSGLSLKNKKLSFRVLN
ncbi:hypothetical protein ABMA58_18235, partial [Oceanospirillum sp. HFRX-1_2]